MEYVCDDAGNTKWYYENGSYIRMGKDGSNRRTIKSEFLPNPDDLLAAKIDAAVANGQKPDVEGLRPSKAIYSLWDHKVSLDKG
jgi:hypothetical protein